MRSRPLPGRCRHQDDRGAIGGVEGIAFGVLLFVLGTLVVVNAWSVIDAKLATSAAAREATRAYVETEGGEDAAMSAAHHAAELALEGQGKPASRIELRVDGGFRRCEPVTVVVSTTARRVPVPLLGAWEGDLTTTSSHTEIVDPYRSGLAGATTCSS